MTEISERDQTPFIRTLWTQLVSSGPLTVSRVVRTLTVPRWLPHHTAREAKPRQIGDEDEILIQDKVE